MGECDGKATNKLSPVGPNPSGGGHVSGVRTGGMRLGGDSREQCDQLDAKSAENIEDSRDELISTDGSVILPFPYLFARADLKGVSSDVGGQTRVDDGYIDPYAFVR